MEAGMNSMTLIVAAVLGFGGDLEGVVLDFTSRSCGPCQSMSPIVSRLEREGYPIRKVDCESNPDLVKRFRINSIPAFVLVINGDEKSRLTGIVSEQQLVQLCARVPRPTESGDSLGAPAPLPGKPDARRESDVPTPSSKAPRQEFPEKKSGLQWPFGNRKKDEPPHEPPAGSISRGKVDDRQKFGAPAVGNPLAASVRIRLRGATGDSVGSGTIIDCRVGQTIIITCGHIFRNWNNKTVIEVDWFENGRAETMIGKHLFHDLEADVGLIVINADWIPSCRVAPPGTKIVKGAPVITVGCSGGDKPTVQQSKVTYLNRFKGADNIEVGGMPVEGRSGGGLFLNDGTLIGVCSGADEKYKEGYYVGLETLHQILGRCQLSRLYRAENGDSAAESDGIPGSVEMAQADLDPVEQPDAEEAEDADDSLGEPASPPAPAPRKPQSKPRLEIVDTPPTRRRVEPRRPLTDETSTQDSALAQAGEAEIVCIIRPINRPGAASRVVILNRASRRFVEYLADEIDDRPEIVETTLQSRDKIPAARQTVATRQVQRPTSADGVAAESALSPKTQAPKFQSPNSQPSGPQAYRRQRSS
jgi:thiol-disulfide isomerase/thioredoxin